MRLKVTFFCFTIAFVVIVVRLFYWQIVRSEDLTSQANYQYSQSKSIDSPRGEIFANDRSYLVATKPAWLLFVEKPKIKNLELIINSLAVILDEDRESLYQKLSKKESVWIPIKRKISNEQKKAIEDLKLAGLGFEAEDGRYYPEGSSSAHLLGFVGKNKDGDDIGYFGLEGYYDLSLKGKSGFVKQEKDLSGSLMIGEQGDEISLVSGANLITYLDKRIINIVESKLREGIEKYQAKEGSVVVMDPQSGGILAMTSYPSYDPIKYNEYEEYLYKNPVISDNFEPGSIFKVIVMASALDAKAVALDTVCDICEGPLKIDKYLIETWNKKYYPNSNMTDVIVHSDNVGMSFVAQKLGIGDLFKYLNKFGIGQLTGIDLQGESNIPMRKKGDWSSVDLVTASFGQGISVTSLQIVRAVSAIANYGLLPKPKVVNQIELDGWKQQVDRGENTRVISEETAQKMIEIMTEAAKSGEAKWTNLQGFSVAGKTGTAQIPIAGHYDPDKTIASFVGFAPAKSAKFVMLVTLKEPQSSQWASETAAPLWYSIAKELFIYFGIQPKN